MEDILKRLTTLTTTASFAFIPQVAIFNFDAEATVEARAGETAVIQAQATGGATGVNEEEEAPADSGEVDSTIDVDINGAAEVDLNNEANQETTNESVEDDTDVTDGVFTFVRSDLLAQEEEAGNLEEVTADIDPETVSDNTVLATYAQSLLVSDEDAERVEVTEGAVALTYKQRAEFLGLVPVLVDTTVTVDEAGEVTIDYPWYRFMASVDEDSLRTAIESNVEPVLAADVEADSDETQENGSIDEDGVEDTTDIEADTVAFTAGEKAQVLAGVYMAMLSELEASAEANGEAQVETE